MNTKLYSRRDQQGLLGALRTFQYRRRRPISLLSAFMLMAAVLVPITFGIAAAILIESGLSYLGFGASPPNPSWGTLLKSGRNAIQQTWWLIVFPGTAIFLTVLAYNLIGEGLQEATDPRLRQDSH